MSHAAGRLVARKPMSRRPAPDAPLTGEALAARLAEASRARAEALARPDAREAAARGAVRPGRAALGRADAEPLRAARWARDPQAMVPRGSPIATAQASGASSPAFRHPPWHRMKPRAIAASAAMAAALTVAGLLAWPSGDPGTPAPMTGRETASAAERVAPPESASAMARVAPSAPSRLAPPVADPAVTPPDPASAGRSRARPVPATRRAASPPRSPQASAPPRPSVTAPPRIAPGPPPAPPVPAGWSAAPGLAVSEAEAAAASPPIASASFRRTPPAPPGAPARASPPVADARAPAPLPPRADGAQPVAAVAPPRPRPEAPAAAGAPRIFVHHVGAESRAEARRLADALGGATLVEVGFQVSRSHVRFYHAGDRTAAERAAALASPGGQPPRDFTGFEPPPSPGLIEVWLAGTP